MRERTSTSAALMMADPRSEEERERAEKLAASVLTSLVREATKIEDNVKGEHSENLSL